MAFALRRPRPPATPPTGRLHFHGGYGFMLEYDIQLHYRRARGWAASAATPSGLPAGRRSRATGPSALTAGRADMDFRLGDRAEALRAEVQAFLDEHMTPELEEQLYRTGVSHDDGLHQGAGRAGLDRRRAGPSSGAARASTRSSRSASSARS